jgi:peptidyl-prolyl cis-trans isomerase A (cyclophilin A)
VKVAIAAVVVIVVGLAAVVGVYQFRESRMLPSDLDAMREAERRLAEAEQAARDLEMAEVEYAGDEIIEIAQAPEVEAETEAEMDVEWKQIDAPAYDGAAPFYVKFSCSMGDFVVQFYPHWSPNGVKRIYELTNDKFFDDIRFFRVVEGFMAQFGVSGDPGMNQKWGNANIPDDPVVESNKRGYVTFAMGGPNTRSTQLFINFGDNSRLDNYGAGFPPIGKVVSGMDAVDAIFSGYGDMPSQGGTGPNPAMIESGGNTYLNEYFPKLDYIKKARFVEPVEAEAAEPEESEQDEAA